MESTPNLHPNILFTDLNAFSNNSLEIELKEQTKHFHIPGLIGNLVAFNINGNSMAPTIQTGDMVICQPLESFRELKDKDVYAVVTNQSVWVKRVEKIFDTTGKWIQLKLISDNIHEFDPFIVDLKEVRRLLKVKHRLTGLEEY